MKRLILFCLVLGFTACNETNQGPKALAQLPIVGPVNASNVDVRIITTTNSPHAMFTCTLISGTAYCWGDPGNLLNVTQNPEPIAVHHVTSINVTDEGVFVVANVVKQPYMAYKGYVSAGVASYKFGPIYPYETQSVNALFQMVHLPDVSLLSPELSLYGLPNQASDGDGTSNVLINNDFTGSQTNQVLSCTVSGTTYSCPESGMLLNGQTVPAFTVNLIP
jgi:hypothetical protein